MNVKVKDLSYLLKKLNRVSNFVVIFWTFMILFSFFWDMKSIQDSILYTAKHIAATEFSRDFKIRQWVAMNGGIYVPESEQTPSNPYLKVKDKDIVLPSGKTLTLMNPAYFLRKIHEVLFLSDTITKGHLTSLNAINPNNEPDSWERSGLKLFEKGVHEVSGIVKIHGHPYYRFMKPMMVDNDCLKCHEVQGYKVGDIRGGISQTVDLLPFYEFSYIHKVSSGIIHFIILLIGIIAVKWGTRYLVRIVSISIDTEKNLSTTQTELYYKSELLQVYMDKSPLIYLEFDKDFRIIGWNKKAEENLGYQKSDILGQNVQLIIPDFERDKTDSVGQYLINNDCNGYFATNYNVRQDGELIYCEWYNTPIIGADGKIEKVICMGNNITQQKEYKDQLLEQNILFDTLINSSKDIIFLKSPDGRYLLCNDAFFNTFGVSREEILGKSIYDLFDFTVAEKLNSDEMIVKKTRTSVTSIIDYQTPGGTEEVLEVINSAVVNKESGELTGILGIARKQTQVVALQRKYHDLSEDQEKILSTISCGVVRLDLEGNIIYMNHSGLKILGYESENVIGKNLHNLAHTSKDSPSHHIQKDCQVLNTYKGEFVTIDNDVFWDKDGEPINISLKSTPVFDNSIIIGAVITFMDIRKRLEDEWNILNALKEKELLIQEIHHRVKNNMQVIYSLLSLQLDKYADDPVLSEAFTESQNRILSMATVHQMLYQNNDMTCINIRDYIENIVELIVGNYGLTDIQYKIDTGEILFNIDKAIPIGLMMNEIISNSLKHSGKTTDLLILFELKEDKDKYSIKISDNGKGFPNGFILGQTDTLGCELLQGLADQLGGTIAVGNEIGAYYHIRIPF